MTASPLMPKATAVWLIENTGLTFQQIAKFTQLNQLEVQVMANSDVGMMGWDPVLHGQLTREEIERCEENPEQELKLKFSNLPELAVRHKGPRYTPVTKRGDKPDAIAWLLKNHPAISDAQIIRLIGTTKNTIGKIRDRSHWNMSNIKPRDPVMLGLCKQMDLNAELEKIRKAAPVEFTESAANELVISSISEPSDPIMDLGGGEEQPSDAGFESLMHPKKA